MPRLLALLYLLAALAAASAAAAHAATAAAEEFARGMLEEMEAEVKTCPDDLPVVGPDQAAACGQLEMTISKFLRKWEHRVRARRKKPLWAAATSEWESRGGFSERTYNVDGASVLVRRRETGRWLVILYSSNPKFCPESRRRGHPDVFELDVHSDRFGKQSYVPEFPAKAERMRGEVIIDGILRKDGTVDNLCVAKADPPGHGFEREAVRAVHRWRYQPVTKDGAPVEVYLHVTVKWDPDH